MFQICFPTFKLGLIVLNFDREHRYLGIFQKIPDCFGSFRNSSVCFGCFDIGSKHRNKPKKICFGFTKQTETNAKQILFRFVSVRTETFFFSFRGHPSCTYCCIFSIGTREGWLLLTVETEANGEFRKYILYERDPSMVGSLGSPNRYKRFLFFLGCYCRPTYKIFFYSSKTISLHLSPSPSKLARQSCSVASPLICVSDVPPCSLNRKRRDLNVSIRTSSGILARYS